MERYAPTLKDLASRDFVSRCDGPGDQGRPRLRAATRTTCCSKLDHLGAETSSRSACRRSARSAIKFANVDSIKEPIPVVPTIHYQMGGIPTNIHGQVVAPKDGDPNAVVDGPLRGRRVRVRLRARRQPPRHQFAARPAGVRPRGRQPHRRAHRAERSAHKPLPADAADCAAGAPGAARRARPAASTSQDVANDLRKTMQAHCGVFRTQALLAEGVGKIMAIAERARAHRHQGQVARCSTPRASRRSSSTT